MTNKIYVLFVDPADKDLGDVLGAVSIAFCLSLYQSKCIAPHEKITLLQRTFCCSVDLLGYVDIPSGLHDTASAYV
tara:strand:- start:137 stop:364 length:228 start_codon:yes stop_codon:yes gene_type:complete